MLIRDGDGGGGGGGGGGDERVKAGLRIRPKKTGETVDRRQNNESVKAVSPRHCPVTGALHNCCFNCRAWAESQGQCPLHCCWGTARSERSPTFAAQLHLPTHDLFWAEGPAPPPSSWSHMEPCRCVCAWRHEAEADAYQRTMLPITNTWKHFTRYNLQSAGSAGGGYAWWSATRVHRVHNSKDAMIENSY